MPIDYKRYPILYVDDDAPNLVAFRYALEDRFTVLTAGSGPEGIEILRAQDVAVLLADQKMPEMTGVELCVHALAIRPDVVRIIVTAFTDAHDAIRAINEGRVRQYIIKPWNNEELSEIIESCIDLVHVQRSMREVEQRLLRSVHGAAEARHRVAHELRNPLSPIRSHVFDAHAEVQSALELLAEVEDPRARDARARLLQAQRLYDLATHGLEMVDAIQERYLDKSDRLTPREATSCDAGRVVDAAVRVVRDAVGRDTEVRFVLHGAPTARVPASVLGQIVLNLVTNAAQAMEAGGRPERAVTVRLDVDDGMVVLRTVDTGPGIRPEDVQHIFEPYFTMRPRGTGLGLAIVRDLVERAGGTIRVESAMDAGTTFEVRLPAAPA